MTFVRYSREDKIQHVLQWAAGWKGNSRGESMWSYSLMLGGSHALLNGWLKDPAIVAALTREEKNLVEEAREKSSRAKGRKKSRLESFSGVDHEGQDCCGE
ncbi:hypothetical protein [Streptomyces sp. NPDC048419]|uniref:hypothetical protein n=1 Tax=Streptomyces sp. NPDC048419 TaxID=3365547 RepID=UPI0037183F9B